MEESLASLSRWQRLCLQIGQAVRGDRVLLDAIERFVDKFAGFGTGTRDFDEAVEAVRARLLLRDFETLEDNKIDEEAATAMVKALDFAVEAHKKARWLIDQDWAPVEGSDGQYSVISLSGPEGSDPTRLSASFEEFEEVNRDLGEAFSRASVFTFLVGDFFKEGRADNIRFVSGDPEPE